MNKMHVNKMISVKLEIVQAIESCGTTIGKVVRAFLDEWYREYLLNKPIPSVNDIITRDFYETMRSATNTTLQKVPIKSEPEIVRQMETSGIIRPNAKPETLPEDESCRMCGEPECVVFEVEGVKCSLCTVCKEDVIEHPDSMQMLRAKLKV